MPDDERNMEHLEEKLPLGEQLKETAAFKAAKIGLDAVLDAKPEDDPGEDQEEPMTVARRIAMITKIFPIALGSKVRNKLGEDGFVEMVGIDYRGALYLVQYKDQNSRWHPEAELSILHNYDEGAKEAKEEKDPRIGTDIPQPKTPFDESE
jgi:hypothetical protein